MRLGSPHALAQRVCELLLVDGPISVQSRPYSSAVGIEDVTDLQTDLEQAFESVDRLLSTRRRERSFAY